MKKFLAFLMLLAAPCQCSKAFAVEDTAPSLNFPVIGEAGAIANWSTESTPKGVYVLEVFYNACGACNENAQNVEDLFMARLEDKQVQVLAVSIDQKQSEYTKWFAKHGKTVPVLMDVNKTFLKAEKIRYVPTVIVKDCALENVYKHIGVWSENTKLEINEAIEAAKGRCPMDSVE